MKILIAGLGYLGQQLAQYLSPNHEVFGVKRHEIATSFPLYLADLRHLEELKQLPEVDVVVIALSAGGRKSGDYRATYLGATINLRERYPNARLLFVSSTSVYGQSADEILTEETEPQPTTESSTVLRETELFCLNDGNALVVRPSGIYGPGRTRFIRQLALRDRTEELENGACRTNRIHRDDLAALIVSMIEQPQCPQLILATDREPATIAEVDAWLKDAPFFAAFQKMLKDEPLAIPPAQFAMRKSRYLSSKRLKELGFEFSYPSFRQGYAKLIYDLLACKQGGQTPTI